MVQISRECDCGTHNPNNKHQQDVTPCPPDSRSLPVLRQTVIYLYVRGIPNSYITEGTQHKS